MRMVSWYEATLANFSLCTGSNISRPADNGMKLMTFFSNITGIDALFIGVPMCEAIKNTLSWFTSFCVASTARLGS